MSHFALLVALVPWVGLIVFMAGFVRVPRELPRSVPASPEGGAGEGTDGPGPSVSVVVPARNEAANIRRCLESLAASEHPDFEIVVVDDRSEDETAAHARAVAPGNARAIRVVEGEPLPDGWLGKPWACWQGAREARGDLLLFTDADTVHERALLARAVAGLEEDGADLLTVAGRQIMGTFWERVVQPQVFFTMIIRFWNVERWVAAGRWREVIANGQYMLFRREAYRALDGHRAVRREVVEDLAMAQHVVRSGGRLAIRMAEDDFATRMYTSLGELVRGWGKNIHTGGQQSFPPWIRPAIPLLSVAGGIGLWLLPPVVLLAGLAGFLGPVEMVGLGGGVADAAVSWAALAVLLSLAIWAAVYHRMGAGLGYALAYPLGAAVSVWIYARSWRNGRNVEWKGRRYRLQEIPE
jgi:chlorobactene glucosyltransferase